MACLATLRYRLSGAAIRRAVRRTKARGMPQQRAGTSLINRAIGGLLLAETNAGDLLAGLAFLHGHLANLPEGRGEVRGFLFRVGLQDEDYGVLGLVNPVGEQTDTVLHGVLLGHVASKSAHHVRVAGR